MASFKFEYLTTLGFAAIVIFAGRAIVAHSALLRKYAIPAPVVSGIIFSIIVSAIKGAGIVGISFDTKIMAGSVPEPVLPVRRLRLQPEND